MNLTAAELIFYASPTPSIDSISYQDNQFPTRLSDMPKATKSIKEEDSKPYIQPEAKKAQKSPQKNSEGPWTPDQAWLLFNALYKKGKPIRLAPCSARQTLPAIRIVKLTAVRFCYTDKVDWKMVSEAVGRSSKASRRSFRRKVNE